MSASLNGSRFVLSLRSGAIFENGLDFNRPFINGQIDGRIEPADFLLNRRAFQPFALKVGDQLSTIITCSILEWLAPRQCLVECPDAPRFTFEMAVDVLVL